jgi:hypothetical protein
MASVGRYAITLGFGLLTTWALLACGESPKAPDDGTGDLMFTRVAEPLTLNSEGRALFANVLLNGEQVIVTYQTANADSLTDGKNLYFQTFDRALTQTAAQAVAIDVDDASDVDWQGDLGDHKLVLSGDSIYMVAILKGQPGAGVLKFGLDFSYQAGPTIFGNPSKEEESQVDMGFTSDGENLYAQFFSRPAGGSPDTWRAVIYRLTHGLEPINSAFVQPEKGSIVTGTAIIHVPAGQMNASADRLQSFSTNLDYGHAERVGIHTFASDMTLNLIQGSTRDILVAELDTYFPVGPSFNRQHQIWVVGYTMENEEGEHGAMGKSKELGPSFISLFDAKWTLLETIQINEGNPAFRVMTQTEGDDIYVVYDEMDKDGTVTASRARIERYTIQAP